MRIYLDGENKPLDHMVIVSIIQSFRDEDIKEFYEYLLLLLDPLKHLTAPIPSSYAVQPSLDSTLFKLFQHLGYGVTLQSQLPNCL